MTSLYHSPKFASAVPVDTTTVDFFNAFFGFFQNASLLNIFLMGAIVIIVMLIYRSIIGKSEKSNENIVTALNRQIDSQESLNSALNELVKHFYILQTTIHERNQSYQSSLNSVMNKLDDIDTRQEKLFIEFTRFSTVRCAHLSKLNERTVDVHESHNEGNS